MGITDLTKKIIGYYISSMISQGKTNRPVELISFYQSDDGIEAIYKTTSLIGTNSKIVKKGLFNFKDGQWFFGELDYRKTEEEYYKENSEIAVE